MTTYFLIYFLTEVEECVMYVFSNAQFKKYTDGNVSKLRISEKKKKNFLRDEIHMYFIF